MKKLENHGIYTGFDLLNKIYELADRGLHTDGAYHKQWYLERILELLASEDDRSFLEPREHGIAP
jgi:hypothetical protein